MNACTTMCYTLSVRLTPPHLIKNSNSTSRPYIWHCNSYCMCSSFAVSLLAQRPVSIAKKPFF